MTIRNPIGRLVTADTSSATSFSYIMRSYDPMGRVSTQWQWFPARAAQVNYAFSVNAQYNLVGSPTAFSNETSWFYPQYDTAARVTGLTTNLNDSQHPATLATVDPSAGYYPTGALRKMIYGNGLTQAIEVESRLQPCEINLNSSGSLITGCGVTPSGTIQDFHYSFGNWGTTNNGNVTNLVGAGTQNFSRTYTYDSLNRLATMSAPGDSCSGLSWTIDPWGNRTSQTTTSGSCYQQPSTTFSTKNQLPPPYQYDAAGNMTYDGTHNYTYDAENHLIQVDGTPGNCSAATACYIYDAETHRVQKTASGVTTAYVYDIVTDQVLEETNGSDTMQVGYVYLGGQPIAEYKSGTTYFVHGDHLGSTRLVTDLYQNVAQNLDYLPYGELNSTDTGITTHEFTGDEQDAETALAHTLFRQYSSNIGRWMTPDPAGLAAVDPSNPQSWNRYAYVLNNVLTYVDPSGLIEACTQIPNEPPVCVNYPDDPSPTNPNLGNLLAGDAGGGAPNLCGGGFVSIQCGPLPRRPFLPSLTPEQLSAVHWKNCNEMAIDTSGSMKPGRRDIESTVIATAISASLPGAIWWKILRGVGIGQLAKAVTIADMYRTNYNVCLMENGLPYNFDAGVN